MNTIVKMIGDDERRPSPKLTPIHLPWWIQPVSPEWQIQEEMAGPDSGTAGDGWIQPYSTSTLWEVARSGGGAAGDDRIKPYSSRCGGRWPDRMVHAVGDGQVKRLHRLQSARVNVFSLFFVLLCSCVLEFLEMSNRVKLFGIKKIKMFSIWPKLWNKK